MQLKENKVWIDGCFDFTHYGHAGAILQARRTIPKNALDGELYCGVHNDADITFNKGPPVMNSEERYAHTMSNRWCSRVIPNAPYVTDPKVLDGYGCKYVVHGDDITLDANGEDCYQEMKDLGRFRVVKRTDGVSTTDIIHRMLTHKYEYDDSMPNLDLLTKYCSDINGYDIKCFVFNEILQNIIVKGVKRSTTKGYIIINGDFDLFHMGHIEQIKYAYEILYPDREIYIGLRKLDLNGQKTIMSLKERLLSILSCKYVDGIIIEPKLSDINNKNNIIEIDSQDLLLNGHFSKYLTKQTIIDRIESQRDLYIARNLKKGMSY
ncbi:similar to Saccharomyces cerevisiae YGR007W ECT1 Ethanolamine-phosphate cytidylyltransferase, catalyzes the second step of phosphatidylethanolamine biosynthesis [Maudiozyma saulgeensis]|uniref:ethanolamine-phosphate cytidylyltransferase n=1 Tax=Maudiozyma saulgeensis TaxID=1789683 RepID=A0A1X7RAP9_9SACH|nr:similar to Saccharomyces cerevisiae YGR007W ECT1 Ethanolamine-phosphate cytidylyltransferase, catalyzes the second step of phosphatidylethanolamine biosynthesis [Kazachstania saulgeensis]